MPIRGTASGPAGAARQAALGPPPPPPGLIVRERLARKLTRSAAHPFTLVAAPPGAGKTTLVAAWTAAGQAPGPVAWVSFDGVPARRRAVWTRIAEALAGAEPALAGLAFPASGSIEAALGELRERLDALEHPVVLVLDDFQDVGTEAFATDIDRLLAVPPRWLRLVVLTRHDPLMRLQRLRVGGTMTDLRMRDLAMTEGEAAALLGACGASVARHDATTLWHRTEGWAAGLRLAGLTLRGHADPAAFVAAFAGDDAAVADYLVDEVLSRRPAAEREFLLRTSIVDELSGDLADAMTGDSDGDAVLRRLALEGAMVTALEEPRGAFRFHPLLRDLLRARLVHAHRGEVGRLHRRAAIWLAAHGDVRRALRHALAAGDGALTARIAADGWIRVYLEGGIDELRALVEELPAEATRGDPGLALALAASRAEDGNVAQADEALAAAEAAAGAVRPERAAQFSAMLGIVLMRRARLHGDLVAALARARALIDDDRLRTLHPRGLRALGLANLGIAELWVGERGAATRDLEAASAAARESGLPYVAALAHAHLALLAGFEGRLRLAVDRAQKAIELVEAHGFTRTSAAAAAYLVRGGVELAWDDAHASELSLRAASAALVACPERALAGTLAVMESKVLALRGDLDAALARLRLATFEAGDDPPDGMDVGLVAQEGLLLHALGDAAEAEALLERRVAEHDGADVRVALARLRLVAGRVDDALTLVGPVAAMSPSASVRVWGLATEAIARDALLDHDGAGNALERALDFAEPRGLRRPFLAVGAPLRPVLRRQIRRETAHRALVAELLEGLDRSRDDRTTRHDAELLDPLSERELTVLRYLPTMMSNTEIAAELFVSVNTVKTHLKQIYRKLDVTSRRDAVRRARAGRLLSPGRREA
jgi:LuxR family maltose regulon positive regulatory protein